MEHTEALQLKHQMIQENWLGWKRVIKEYAPETKFLRSIVGTNKHFNKLYQKQNLNKE
jgi:hypothetical protein